MGTPAHAATGELESGAARRALLVLIVGGGAGGFALRGALRPPSVIRVEHGVPFLTGVVYYDFNGNNFYDLGEGTGGVVVTASGSSFFATTANSGGYSVPVPENNNSTTVTTC